MNTLHFLAVTVPSENIGVPQVDANDSVITIILNMTFTVIGAVAVLFLIIGAFRYIISNGEQAQIQKAKNTIMYSVIGIVVSLLAFTIVQFVLGRIFG
jgi:hypothetical protein